MLDDGRKFGVDDDFMDPNMDIHSLKGKWKGTTTCEYVVPEADEPIDSVVPSIEISDESVAIHHKHWRSRKAKPTECSQFPQDPDLYTGERFTIGVYEDGEEFACIDRDWRTNLVPETEPLKTGVRFKGSTVFKLKPKEKDCENKESEPVGRGVTDTSTDMVRESANDGGVMDTAIRGSSEDIVDDEDDLTGEPHSGFGDGRESYSEEFKNARDEAMSLDHLMDHYPKNKFCKACQCGKIQSQQSRRSKGLGPPPKEFGDQVTADHIISRSARSESITGALDSLLIYDRATRWIDCYPVRSQGANDVYNRFLQFIGPWQKVKYVYTDDSAALKAALAELKICNDSSVLGQPKTNGIAERQVKEVVHGIRTILFKAGLPNCFWPYAMRHFCFARNIKVDKTTGMSPHIKRFGRDFTGPRIPFGAGVWYKPSSTYERKWRADGKE